MLLPRERCRVNFMDPDKHSKRKQYRLHKKAINRNSGIGCYGVLGCTQRELYWWMESVGKKKRGCLLQYFTRASEIIKSI